MTKFLKNIFSFGLFAAIVYVALVILWGHIFEEQAYKKNLSYKTANYGHQYSRMQEAKLTKEVDLLFLGSSHTYRGFDTRIFRKAGWTVFNLGSSSQSHIQTELLLNRYLKKLHPKMIVYEVYPGLFTVDGIESSLNLLGNDKVDWTTAKTAFQLNHLKVYNTLIYGIYADLTNQHAGLAEDPRKNQDTYISGGYVQRDLSFYQPTSHPIDSFDLKKSQLLAFENSLEIIEKQGIPYLLVQAPVTKGYYDSFTNNAEFDSLMATYGEYVNFNLISNLVDTLHFFDEHHLNQNGVAIFNQELVEILKKRNTQ